MKKIVCMVLSMLMVCALCSCGYAYTEDDLQESYDNGYNDGYDDGQDDAWEYAYDDGYDNGHFEGYDDGYDEGYSEGYDDGNINGNDIGYTNGYSEGCENGYYAGATYTCMFYGDVDRAFQSACNGSAWYTFIDAYDQFISNIFDDDETESELFWALVSINSSDGMSEYEKNLLIDTFGKDLFVRNGIELS